jgi:hypothetical protein
MKRVVLGMAKSSLDLRGAKSQRLELDLLRLVYAVMRIRSGGGEAAGYLLVMTSDQARRATRWLEKYRGEGAVEILVADPTEADLLGLQEEKRQNVAGVAAALAGEDVAGRSTADLGKRYAEDLLEQLIRIREPGVIPTSEHPPVDVNWDYFGVIV